MKYEYYSNPYYELHGNVDCKYNCDFVSKKRLKWWRFVHAKQLKQIPPDAPTSFVPKELRRALTDKSGKINRNAWEMGLALAIKDALRSGDLYLPQSKQHVSFWNMMLSETQYQIIRESSDYQYPAPEEIREILTSDFEIGIQTAQERFSSDSFAEIIDGKLKLKRDDRAKIPSNVQRHRQLHCSCSVCRRNILLNAI